ncbi:MAG: hypothetical protein ABIO94_09575 [Opitutaceae bacterium]
MKTFLIAISLALNMTLVATFAVRPKLAPHAFQDFFSRHGFSRSEEVTSAKPTAQRSPAAVSARPLWSTLASDDPATLVARLRAAGFPASLIRALVTSEIGARYNARMRALIEPDPNTPFWKSSNSGSAFNSGRNEELMRIQQESSRVLRDLFKDEFFASSDVSAAQRRQFGNLPPAKIDQLQRIEDDYAEMNRTLSAATKGVILPEDREKMALLAREKKADLAAVLSPAEFADYTMRSSPITSMLSRQFGTFEPNEAEYRAIFQVQQSLNEQFPMNISVLGSISATSEEQRRAAQQQLEQQLKVTLGDARYADYIRETDREFQQLSQLAQRDNLPASASAQAYSFRESVAQESNRIFDDPSLDAAQKRVALQTLAQNARAQLLATLGPTSGPAYVKIADQWLGNIERGGAVAFKTGAGGLSIMSSNGGVATAVYSGGTSASYRRLPNPTPPNP